MARAYVAFDSTGRLLSWVLSETAFPGDYDIQQVSPANAQAAANRAHFVANQPGFDGFVICDCAHQQGSWCKCAQEALAEKYHSGGSLLDKPTIVVKVDGVVVDFDTHSEDNPLDVVAGTDVTLRVEVAVPDATDQATKAFGAHLDPTPTNLVFTSNAAEITLTAPAAGTKGAVGVKYGHYLIRAFCVWIRGT